MSLINFIENKQDFLKNSELFELIELNNSDVHLRFNIEQEHKEKKVLPFLENVSKIPVYIGNSPYLADTIDFQYNQKLMFRVIKSLKVIIANEDKIKELINDICETVDFSNEILEDAKIVEKLEGYTVYTKMELEKTVKKETENIIKSMIEDNFREIFGYMKGILLTQVITPEELEEDCLKKIKLYYFKDEEIKLNIIPKLMPDWMFDRLIKLTDAYVRDKHNSLDAVKTPELHEDSYFYSNDKRTFREIVENVFLNIVYGTDDWSGKELLTDIVMYYTCLEMKESIKEELVNNYELNKMREVLRSLKKAGKTVMINDKKYENHTIYDESYYIGTGKSCIHAKDVKEIKFGKNVLFNEENFKKEFYEKSNCTKLVN